MSSKKKLRHFSSIRDLYFRLYNLCHCVTFRDTSNFLVIAPGAWVACVFSLSFFWARRHAFNMAKYHESAFACVGPIHSTHIQVHGLTKAR